MSPSPVQVSLNDDSRPAEGILPKTIVRNGWNRLSEVYRPDDANEDRFGHTSQQHREWLEPLMEGLAPGSSVVDLGCGCGVPDCALLSRSFLVTGFDISDTQVERARKLVPGATFVRADMTEVDLPAGSVGAVVCLYALIHVPLAEQRGLLDRIRGWLAPGGYLLVITGHTAWEGVEANWLGGGAPMYWSHADAATYRRWFRELDFDILRQRTVPEAGNAAHELFLLRCPGVRTVQAPTRFAPPRARRRSSPARPSLPLRDR